MGNITQAERQAYRAELIRRGIPEVYAELAAQATVTSLKCLESSTYLIYGAFVWSDSELGGEFWEGIQEEVDKDPNFNGISDLK